MEEKTIEQLMREHQSQPWEFYHERQVLQEPDYHLISLEQAGKLDNKNLDELLGMAEEIEKWLNEPKRLREEQRQLAFEKQQKLMEDFFKE